jgi:hypothetical protein
MVDRFWSSPAGREISWRQRVMRTRYLSVESEPEQKGRRGNRGRSARAQLDLLDQLRAVNQHPLTGPVAVDVAFWASRPQSPGLHNLAKHLLDVLGAMPPETAAPRRYVLYKDDRQVKLLHVRLWRRADASVSSGRTTICARPLRDVAADLGLVHTLEDELMRTSLAEQDWELSWPPIPRRAFELGAAMSGEDANAWLEMDRWLATVEDARHQEQLLASAGALLTSVLAGAPHWIAGVGSPSRPYAGNPAFTDIHAALDQMAANHREMLLSSPLSIPLPGLPRARGEGRTFKAAVRKNVEAMVDRFPALAPLRVPLKVVLLVVPPEQGKDLDNLALSVLPAVHDALNGPDITAYEVIELKRTDADAAVGLLRFALGSGSQGGSTWQRATDYVARCFESP